MIGLTPHKSDIIKTSNQKGLIAASQGKTEEVIVVFRPNVVSQKYINTNVEAGFWQRGNSYSRTLLSKKA
jgi:hypothetical protein